MKNTTNLFAEFTPVSKAEWLAKVEKDLKGRPIDDLNFSAGGVTLSPFHHAGDQPLPPDPLPLKNGWEIGEDIPVKENLTATNAALLAALEAGVNAPRLILKQPVTADEMTVLFKEVKLEMIATQFCFTGEHVLLARQAEDFLQYASGKGVAPSAVKAGFNWDMENAVAPEELSHLLTKLPETGHHLQFMPVNGQADFSTDDPAAELAALLRKGESYLHQFATGAISLSTVHSCMYFSVAIGKDYFLQIAKMRALVLLWANVMKAYGLRSHLPVIEAHLSLSDQTDNDHTNMIAATTQAMSAIIGGANRLTVLPADAHRGESTSAFTRRISRNVQHLLANESHLAHVADPAAGSYYIEKLTNSLAAKAWATFQSTC